jgi:hypothetical protein
MRRILVGERAVSLLAPWSAARSPDRTPMATIPTDIIPRPITAVPACGGAGGMATPGCAAASKRYGWTLLREKVGGVPGGDARHAG